MEKFQLNADTRWCLEDLSWGMDGLKESREYMSAGFDDNTWLYSFSYFYIMNMMIQKFPSFFNKTTILWISNKIMITFILDNYWQWSKVLKTTKKKQLLDSFNTTLIYISGMQENINEKLNEQYLSARFNVTCLKEFAV